jgi:cellulose synthase operon protein C
MKRSLTDWRQGSGQSAGSSRQTAITSLSAACGRPASSWVASLFGGALAVGIAIAPVLLAPRATAAPAATRNEADAATKQLLKASGLLESKLYKLAGQEYQDFLQSYPTHPDANNARYALAICEYQQKDYDKAVELLDRVLKDPKFPQRDEALAVLGHSHQLAGRYDKALAAFDELLEKHSASKQAAGAALNKAQVLYLAQKFPEAATAAESFLKKYTDSPDRPAAMYLLALSHRAQDQNDKAADALQELIAKHPRSPYELDATLLLGQSLEAQGKLDAAAEQYRKMLAAAPSSRQPDGHYSLGLVLSKSAKYDEAARELSAVVTDSPESKYAKPARLQLGLVQLAAGKTAEARRTLTAAAKDAQDAASTNAARYGLAQVDIADRKFDAALATLDELLATQPPPANAPQVALDHAVCQAELGHHDEAVKELATWLRKNPDLPQSAEAQYRQAFSLHKLGKYDQSHAIAKPVGEGKSEFSQPAIELDAENLFLLAQYDAASKVYSALASRAKDAEKKNRFTFRLGQCAYFGGDYARAIELLQPLSNDPKVARDETLGRASFLLGDALLQQGKYAEAAEALQRYASAAPKADRQEAQFKLALAQLRADQADAARGNFQAVASGAADSPWAVRAHFELGQLAYKAQPPQLDVAASELKKAVSAGAPPELAAPAQYLLGWTDFDSKRFPEAAAKWKVLTDKYGNSDAKDVKKLVEDATFQQGVALKEAGQNEEALAALQRYARDYPDGQHLAQSRQLAAAVLSTLHRDDEAKQMLAQLASAKASDSVLYDLAWAQKGTKDPSGAADTYRRLLKDHADSKLAPAAKTELAELLYGDKKYDEAADLLESVVKSSKDADPKVTASAGYLLGWCYQKQNKPEQAAEAFSRYAESKAADPDRAASALLQAGVSNVAANKLNDGIKSLRQMLEKFPQHKDAPVAMLKLGEAEADAGEFDAALKTHREFLDKYASNEFAYRAQFGVGWALENQKKYDEARAAYKKVTDSPAGGETAARAQFQTGETYLAENKFEEAAKELLAVEFVYAFPKWSARALYEAGRAFEQLKQPEQAKAQYAKVLAKYKDQPEAELAQARMKAISGS